MIPALQKITILLLALLQFAAPLVHAHSGMEAAGIGMHIPGLEAWSIGTQEEALSSSGIQIPQKNFLVSVSSAIQEKQPVSANSSTSWSAIGPVTVYAIALDSCLINFSPYSEQFSLSPHHHWHATRAPPFFGYTPV